MKISEINWTGPGGTFNAWIGCTKVDHECKSCYAEVLIDQRYGANKEKRWGENSARTRTNQAQWRAVRKWNHDAGVSGQPHFVFCGSLMDVMDPHQSIPQNWRDDLYQLIDETPHLTWLLLTKRPENYAGYLNGRQMHWPHVWLGTSCGHAESDKGLNRVKALQATPIHPQAHRFISAEPLISDLGTIDLTGISWVICGGESGVGPQNRPFDVRHAWNLYEECKRQGVLFWLKQTGREIVDGGQGIDASSHIHDLSQVPDEYAEMVRRERPAPLCGQPTAPVLPNPELITRLSNEAETAVEHALSAAVGKWAKAQLGSSDLIAREAELRPELVQAVGSIRRNRYELGRIFTEYQKLFKGNYIGMLSAVGYQYTTAREYMADYSRVKDVPLTIREAALCRGIDLAQKKHSGLVTRLKTAEVLALADRPSELAEAVAEAVATEKVQRRQDRESARVKAAKPRQADLVQISLSTSTKPDPETAHLEARAELVLGREAIQRLYRQLLCAVLAEPDELSEAA